MREVRSPHYALVAAIAITTALALPGCFGAKGSKDYVDVEQQVGFDQDSLILRQSRAEARIRACMKAQGFEYVPIDPVAERARLFGTANPKDEQFGYYVTTLWGHSQPHADPNERYRAGLSSADQKAYDRALGGDNPGATFEDAFDTGDFTKLGGCRATAISIVFGGRALLSEIQGKLDQLDEQIVQDQRMVKANDKWRSCMAAAGYHYSEGDDIDVDLQKRLEAIVGPVQGKFASGPAPGQPVQPYDHAALARLQQEELATWRADNACELKYLRPVEDIVRRQYEAQFRAQNLTLLNQVKPVR